MLGQMSGKVGARPWHALCQPRELGLTKCVWYDYVYMYYIDRIEHRHGSKNRLGTSMG